MKQFIYIICNFTPNYFNWTIWKSIKYLSSTFYTWFVIIKPYNYLFKLFYKSDVEQFISILTDACVSVQRDDLR